MRAIASAVPVQLLRGRIAAPRLFLLSRAPPIWIYNRLKARLGQPLAVEIMRIAILAGGTAR